MTAPDERAHEQSPTTEPSPTTEAPATVPWWRRHPVLAVAAAVGILALAMGLLALALLVVLWIWIVASGGLFPNK